jgi:hypothetical protein
MLAVTSNQRTLLVTPMMEGLRYSKALVLTGGTWHHIPEDAILPKCCLLFI